MNNIIWITALIDLGPDNPFFFFFFFFFFLIDLAVTGVMRVDRKVIIVPRIGRAIPHHHPHPPRSCTRRAGSLETNDSSIVLHYKADTVRAYSVCEVC